MWGGKGEGVLSGVRYGIEKRKSFSQTEKYVATLVAKRTAT